ncbi:hypothetical protein [Micromonospora sp. NPDC049282]|uniref:hypothetical protein n=1 Tax=Micromonospora sp. NPDC049282 TaxID=3364269 RepID=UPI003716A5D4
MRMTLAAAFGVAVVSSALAVLINIATDLKNSWWAWSGVVVITALSALTANLLQAGKANHGTEGATSEQGNTIGGDVTGDVVQAREIRGDINFRE